MKTPKASDRARITEIFSSLQGEGPRMGERHIFVRFETCHLACVYCDEAGKKGRLMTAAQVLSAVDNLERKFGPHACVSLTGGEPLLFPDFLKTLCSVLKKKQYRVLLETNGILWRPLSKVLKGCDIIAMDLKLPSVTCQRSFFGEHRKFFEIAKCKDLYIKIVISRDVDFREYRKHLRMVASLAPRTPVFLQPVYEAGRGLPPSQKRRNAGSPGPALVKLLDALQRIGAKCLSDVRVGIQLHKIMNIR